MKQKIIYKIKGNDVAIISPSSHSWYFTNQQGLRVYQNKEVSFDQLSERENLSKEDIAVFIKEVDDILFSELEQSEMAKGGSIHLTNRCNLSCDYCRYACDKNTKGTVTVEDIYWYIGQLAKEGAEVLTVTGGEPTLRWDLLKIIVELASQHRIHVNILTNGKNSFTFNQLKFLSDHQVYVQVSMDSLDDEVNLKTRKIESGLIQRTIKALVTHNIKCNVSMVLNKLNYTEVDLMIDWCLNNNAGLHFALLEKGGRASQKWEKLSLSGKEVKLVFDEALNTWINKQVPEGFFAEFEMIKQKIMYPHFMKSCNAGINNICLAPGSLIYPCSNFVDNPAMIIGYVGETIMSIKNRFQKEHAFNYSQIEKCKDCDFGWICCGGCRDRIMLSNEGIDPYCEVLKYIHETIFWNTLIEMEGGDCNEKSAF